MASGENYNKTPGAASRPPQQGSRDESPLFSDYAYTSGRRVPNNGRPDYSAAPGRTANAASAPYGGRSQDRGEKQDTRPYQRPGRPDRGAPVYTEISWDDLMRSTRNPQNQQPAQPQPQAQSGFQPQAQPGFQPQAQPGFQPQAQPQRRSGGQYFGGFEQEMGELFYSNGADGSNNASRAGQTRSADAAPQAADPSGQTRPRTSVYIPPQNTRQYVYQQPAPRQNAPRQVTPLQSIRETAYRQAARNARNAPPRDNTPAPAKRASGGGTPPGSGGSHVSAAPRRRPRKIHPIFYAGGILVLALVIFLLAKLAGGSKTSTTVPIRPSQETPVSVSAAPAVTSAPEQTQNTPEPTSTPAPTPTPSGPKAKRLGDLIVPADWGVVVPERKKAVYDSFFDRSVMIGNSLTEGFFMWAGMEKNMEFIYGTGATAANALGGLDLAKITLNKSDYYSDIYLMFGLNEIGTDVNSFVQSYKRLVDYIREHQTKANIYIISVTPVTRQVDEDPNEVQSMDRIRTFNSALKEFCADQNCWYLDIYNLMLDKNGYLSGDYAFVGDGKHFEKSGYVAWANYMKLHYVDEGLLTE